jgi:hypothetical protein
MEQLSREALHLLMERARTTEGRADTRDGETASAPGMALWAKRVTPPDVAGPVSAGAVMLAEAPEAFACDGGGDGVAMPIGIERRLVRRAEARWAALKGNAALPEAGDAGALLGPPFASRAMVISFPGALSEGGRPHARARLSRVGDALAEMCAVPKGLVTPDPNPTAPLVERLVALAASALRRGGVCHLDSDDDGSSAAGRPQLLIRAVALPLATATNGVATAIVIASWRKLLSADETAALHRELAAAIAWMHDQGTGPASAT